MAEQLYKYPRTPHVEGSRFQPGDDELDCAPFADLQGKRIVVEEKLDGANAGVSFSRSGKLLLQSRGHFLDGGPRERQFALFKTWATTHH
jgi:RNA ligase